MTAPLVDAATPIDAAPLVVVSVGTYHLPFDRLIDWLQPWIAANPDVRVVVQHGVSKTLTGADNRAMLPPAELLELYDRATAIVLQGGAGGIMDVRQRGRIPIVVPRVPGSGEVVDEHQLAFAERIAELDLAHLATTVPALHDLLDRAIAGTLRSRGDVGAETAGVGTVIEVLNGQVSKVGRLERLRRLGRSTVALARRR